MVQIEEIENWNDDVAHVAEHMRDVDVAELAAVSMSTPEEALRRALDMADDNYVAKLDGEPIAVLGNFTTQLGRVGSPWLLGTDGVTHASKSLVDLSRRYVEHLKHTHTRLANIVHDENRPSKLYLKAIGFTLYPAYKLPNGAMVRTFQTEGYLNV